MSKNRVQFQKGMSLSDFMARYGTEEQCQQTLFAWRWPHGFVCPSCGHPKACALKSRRLLQCAACRHQCSLISDTIFAGTKLSLRVRFLAMFLLTQAKNGLSALQLSRQLGISYNSTWFDETQTHAGDERARVDQAPWRFSLSPPRCLAALVQTGHFPGISGKDFVIRSMM